MKKILISLCALFLITGCSENPEKKNPTPQSITKNPTTEPDKQTNSENELQKKDELNLESLAGFQFVSKINAGSETDTIYSFTPSNESNFSVTVLVESENSNIHSESYPLNKHTIDINGTQVSIGYQEEYIHNGIVFTNAYSSLAFDFEHQDKFFSGEVSNLKGEPSKDQLDTIVTKFVNSILNY